MGGGVVKPTGYGPRIDPVIDSAAVADFTQGDFLTLALAALDQAGVCHDAHRMRWTLDDGEPFGIFEFLADNSHADIGPEVVAMIAMERGEAIIIGGGAAASFEIRRVA